MPINPSESTLISKKVMQHLLWARRSPMFLYRQPYVYMISNSTQTDTNSNKVKAATQGRESSQKLEKHPSCLSCKAHVGQLIRCAAQEQVSGKEFTCIQVTLEREAGSSVQFSHDRIYSVLSFSVKLMRLKNKCMQTR